jgi:hypothetical protein
VKLPTHIEQHGRVYLCHHCSSWMILGTYEEQGKEERILAQWVARHGH